MKSIEIRGFKSFADRTRLELGPGVTAIVGPNGSGKSNIVDAIRWVLGEQNPRELRGLRMEDVIFSGSGQRRPVGLADVTLTFDNSDGAFPLEFTEVSISRRLDRSGGSDYMINRTPCRLKDIVTIFAGSGIGRQAYSYIGQGRVDEVLSGRPEDRRSLLEEAAGISRYRFRQTEIMRCLAYTEPRLRRLADLVRDLEERLIPLEAEAARAERYRILAGRMRQLEVALLASSLRELQGRLAEREGKNDAVRKEMGSAEAEAREAYAFVASIRDALARLDREIETVTVALLEATREEERLRGSVIRARDRLAALRERDEQLSRDLEAYDSRREGGSLDDCRRSLTVAEEKAAAIQHHLQARRDSVRSLQEGVFRIMGEISLHRQQISASQAELQARRRELSRLDEERDSVASQVLGFQKRLGLAESAAAAERERLAECVRRLAELAREKAALAEAVRDRSRQVAGLRDQLGAGEARLSLLREMEASYEGYSAGVRAVLAGRKRGEAAFAGVIGVVAQLVSAPESLRLAIEVALGPAQEYIVVESGAVAQRVIEVLRRHKAGRATFLPLGEIRASRPDPADRALSKHPDAIGWAVELVTCEQMVEPAICNVLGRVLVAKDLAGARRLAAESRYRYRIVTPEGDVIHPGGAITGGVPQAKGRGLLSRAAEIERLSSSLSETKTRLARMEAELQDLEQRSAQVQAAWQGCSEEERALRQEVARLEAEAERLRSTVTDLGRRKEAIDARGAELSEALNTLESLVNERMSLLGGLEERERECRRALEEAEAEVLRLEQEREALASEVVRLRMRLGALEHAEAGMGKIHGELQRVRCQIEEASGVLDTELAALARAEETKLALEEELRGFQEERRRRQTEAHACEERIRLLRQRLDQLGNELRRGEVEVARIQAEAGAILNVLTSRYGLREEEAVALRAEGSREEMEANLMVLWREVDSLGPVNHRAPEEMDRHRAFLNKRRAELDDITRAWEGFRDAVGLLDRLAEGILCETLEVVRREFRTTFTRLFGGGQVDVILTDQEKPLSSGVEILAQPPAKRLQHLSLLSGGEKALTAIAFLLALLRVRPAPFCILDEFDAPLDESNVLRVAEYIKELADPVQGIGTQFLVITHQKATMEMADRLLGVVMDQGVSRVVAVQLAPGRAAQVQQV